VVAKVIAIWLLFIIEPFSGGNVSRAFMRAAYVPFPFGNDASHIVSYLPCVDVELTAQIVNSMLLEIIIEIKIVQLWFSEPSLR